MAKQQASSERLKRKTQTADLYASTFGDEKDDLFYLVSFHDSPYEYSVVDSKQIRVESDGTSCTVRHRGHWHAAKVIKKGRFSAENVNQNHNI